MATPKQKLGPGRGLNDWIRVLKTQPQRAPRPISMAELAQHQVGVRKHVSHAQGPGGEVWMALGGRVYDITAYMAFHPGGRDELLRGSGADATALFLQVGALYAVECINWQVHPWVKIESFLDKFFVGMLQAPPRKFLGVPLAMAAPAGL
jgi:cytochrome b involved in lipid metabolism